jgi:hypothetical protein
MLLCIVVAAVLIGFGPLGVAWLGGVGALSLWFIYFRKSTKEGSRASLTSRPNNWLDQEQRERVSQLD